MEKEAPIKTQFATLDDIDAVVVVANADGEVVFVNRAAEHILGFTPSELLGNDWYRLTGDGDPKEDALRKQRVVQMINGDLHLSHANLFESQLSSKNGSKVWTQWTNSITAENHLVGVAQDITEKKCLEEELLRKNRENELLLKEIHHRVKNNLQIVSSLLKLQLGTIDNELVEDVLNKSQGRINSMAMLHTRLYESDNFGTIDFGAYLEELMVSIRHSYFVGSQIQYEIIHDHQAFDLDQSIYLGLIVTELVTNAFKHAFVGRESGIITLDISNIGEDHCKLMVKDNGVGISKAEDAHNTLGLDLVDSLCDQINGTMQMTSSNGVQCEVIFPIN